MISEAKECEQCECRL